MDQTYLLPQVKELLEFEDAVRIEHIQKDQWIGYPRAQEALIKLDQLFLHPQRSRMPNLLVIAPTNNGKTMIINKFLRDRFPERVKQFVEEEDLLLDIPIVSMQMPPSPEIKRFYLALLEKIDPHHGCRRMNVAMLEQRVYQYMRSHSVRMLIIDEIHNALAGNYRQQIEFLNVLRYIGNEIKIPLICVGTKDAYLAIRSDDQLENRFEPFALPLWSAGDNFEALLASFISLLPLKKYSNLNSPSVSSYILAKSEGIIGEMATFIKRAAALAITSGQEYIDTALLNAVDYYSPRERRKIFERELV